MNRNVRKRTFWHVHLAKILETEENIFALTRTILRNPFSHVAANMWPYLPVFGRLSYHTCSKIRTSTIHHPILCLKIAGLVANRVDPDETPQYIWVYSFSLIWSTLFVSPNAYYGTNKIVCVVTLRMRIGLVGGDAAVLVNYILCLQGDVALDELTLIAQTCISRMTAHQCCYHVSKLLCHGDILLINAQNFHLDMTNVAWLCNYLLRLGFWVRFSADDISKYFF